MQASHQNERRPGMNGLTSAQVATLQRLLENKRNELRTKHEQHVGAALHGADERSESMDLANEAASEAELLELAERERRVLMEIEEALDRIDRGTYGLSQSSGARISFERLLAIPWARSDASEQDLLERP